jgi:hypothetical protein
VPAWAGGAIAFLEVADWTEGPYTPTFGPVLVRLAPDGRLLSRSTLALPKMFAGVASGTLSVSLYPCQGGLLLRLVATPAAAGASKWATGRSHRRTKSPACPAS